MQAKIKFNDQEVVVDFCRTRFINGKLFLEVSVLEQEADDLVLRGLKNNPSGKVYYYEKWNDESDWDLKMTYEDFNSGEFQMSYADGIYVVRVGHMDAEIQQLNQNTADIQYIAIMSGIPL